MIWDCIKIIWHGKKISANKGHFIYLICTSNSILLVNNTTKIKVNLTKKTKKNKKAIHKCFPLSSWVLNSIPIMFLYIYINEVAFIQFKSKIINYPIVTNNAYTYYLSIFGLCIEYIHTWFQDLKKTKMIM